MRLAVIGPSGSGKTTLSRLAAEYSKCAHLDLDKFFVDFESTTKYNVAHFSETDVLSKIDKVVSGKDWVIEGIYPIESILEKSDSILYLSPGFLLSLIFQWKRYFTDPGQRKNFGFLNNVILSWIIFRQYFSLKKNFLYGDFMYPTQAGYEQVLKKYAFKVKRISRYHEYEATDKK